MIIHSTRSGKGDPEEGRRRILELAGKIPGEGGEPAGAAVRFAGSEDEIDDICGEIIERGVPRIALSGGDGFTALFMNHFFARRRDMGREDYNPDVLFLPGGTGNAVSFCSRFRSPGEALEKFASGGYTTERLNMLKVFDGGAPELAHFVSFGADGEIISIYESQKLKGFLGYLWAVVKYTFSRRLYNIFSRNDANFDLDITSNGEPLHSGRYEGGGISAIPFIGYGFRPYPLARHGNAHLRFVLYGVFLMPTLFKFTRWNFLRRPNRIIFDHLLSSPATVEFNFDREMDVQVAGELWKKSSSVKVECSHSEYINMALSEGG